MSRARRKGAKAYLASIGLKAPYTGKPDDYAASEPVRVRQLYESDIIRCCKRHVGDSPGNVRRSRRVRKEAQDLFEKYGPRIWCREAHRPWLLQPGNHKFGTYPRDMYYDDPRDRRHLQHHFTCLVISKIIRYIQDHGSARRQRQPTPNETSDADGDPLQDDIHEDERCSSLSESPESINLEPGCRHFHVAGLKEQGVWIGEWSEGKGTVNGPCWNEMRQRLKRRIEMGSDHASVSHPGRFNHYIQCAMCNEGPKFKLILIQMTQTAFVWALPFSHGSRECNVIVKPSFHGSENLNAWELLTTDGKFTCKSLLKSFLEPSSPCNDLDTAGPSRPSQLPAFGSRTDSPSVGADQHRWATEENLEDGPDGDQVSDGQVEDFVIHTAGLRSTGPILSSKAVGKRPLRQARPTPSAEHRGLSRPSRPTMQCEAWEAQAGEQICDDAGEDIQPSNERNSVNAGVLHDGGETMRGDSSIAKRTTVSMPSPKDEASRGDAQTPSIDRTLTFYFTMGKSLNYKIVKLGLSMSFETAYGYIQRKLNQRRKVGDMRDFDLTFKLPFWGSDELEQSVYVEVDDEDSWEEVVEHVNQKHLKTIYGTISMRSD